VPSDIYILSRRGYLQWKVVRISSVLEVPRHFVHRIEKRRAKRRLVQLLSTIYVFTHVTSLTLCCCTCAKTVVIANDWCKYTLSSNKKTLFLQFVFQMTFNLEICILPYTSHLLLPPSSVETYVTSLVKLCASNRFFLISPQR